MKTGLLWYDGDPKRSFECKIERAASRYLEKYGRLPDTCYVHPQAVDGSRDKNIRLAYPLLNQPFSIRVRTAANVLLHHFWLGETEQQSGTGEGPGWIRPPGRSDAGQVHNQQI